MKALTLRLVIAQMALQGLSANTIKFFENTYMLLEQDSGVSCMELSNHYRMTVQATSRHVKKLEEGRYVKRIGRYCWKIGKTSEMVRDQHLVMVADMFGCF